MAAPVPVKLEDLMSSNGLTPFPKDDIDPAIKETPEWNLLVAKAIFGNRYMYGGGLFYNNSTEYSENLKWALGKQDDDEAGTGLMSQTTDISFMKLVEKKIKNYITQRINIVIKKVIDNRYDVEVESINPIAVDAKEDYKARLQLYLDEKEFFDDVQKRAGVDVSALMPGQTDQPGTPTMPEMPESQEDLDVFFDSDYKTLAEIGIELGIKHHLGRNKFDAKIRPMMVFDEFVYGVKACYDGMDDNLMPIVEYVHPPDLIVPHSKTPDWTSNLPYVGELIDMTAADFRKSASGFLKTEVIDDCIARFSRLPIENYNYSNVTDLIRPTDVHRIRILRYNYRSTDMIAKVMKKDSAGNPVLYSKEYDYYAPKEVTQKTETDEAPKGTVFDEEGGKKKLYRKPVNTVYEGYHVVGSDVVYRQGRRAVSLRKRGNLSEDLMGYKIFASNAWAGQVTPTMRMIIPCLKNLRLYTFKIQQAVRAAIPKGGFIDLDGLRNAKLKWDNKDMSDQQKIEMFMMTGWGITSSKNRHAPGSNYKPFTEAENGMAKDVLVYGKLIQDELMELDSHIGLNAASSAATLSPEMGKGVVESQIAATDVALGWMIDSDKNVFSDLCESLAIQHVKSIKYGPKEYYNRVFGRLTTGLLYSDIPFHKMDFGFMVKTQPTQVEWKELFDAAAGAYQNGAGWLTFAQLTRLKDFESLKQARRFLSNCEKKAMKAQSDKAQSDMQNNAQLQQGSADSKTKGEIAIIQEKTKGELAVKAAERQNMYVKYDLETKMRIAVQQDQRGLAPVIANQPAPTQDIAPSPAPELENADQNAQLMDDLKS